MIIDFDDFCPHMMAEKFDIKSSKLGPNGKILINPAKVIFGYGNRYIYSIMTFYSVEVIRMLL